MTLRRSHRPAHIDSVLIESSEKQVTSFRYGLAVLGLDGQFSCRGGEVVIDADGTLTSILVRSDRPGAARPACNSLLSRLSRLASLKSMLATRRRAL